MKRDWTMALLKVKREGKCRYCGWPAKSVKLEAAHVIPRSLGGSPNDQVLGVEIVPLCRICHVRYDEHRMDLLPLLTKDEQAEAVRKVGIVSAYEITTSDKISKR